MLCRMDKDGGAWLEIDAAPVREIAGVGQMGKIGEIKRWDEV